MWSVNGHACTSNKVAYKISGFEQAVQAYAVHVLSLTFERVPRSVLAEVWFSVLIVILLPSA